MTEPQPSTATPAPEQPPLDPEQALRQVGAILVSLAPAGWRRLDLTIRQAGRVRELALRVIMPDGSTPVADVTPDHHQQIGDLFAQLRHAMYRPGQGTWFSARYTVDPPGSYHVTFNYDFDPHWQPPIPPQAWQEDLQHYPRDEEHTPRWLRDTLNPTTAQEESGTGQEESDR